MLQVEETPVLSQLSQLGNNHCILGNIQLPDLLVSFQPLSLDVKLVCERRIGLAALQEDVQQNWLSNLFGHQPQLEIIFISNICIGALLILDPFFEHRSHVFDEIVNGGVFGKLYSDFR